MWANIHAKRKRGEAPAKKGDPDRPDAKSWKDNTDESIAEYELFVKKEDNSCFTEWLKENKPAVLESEYQGRKVKLNSPSQGDVSKFKVYVKKGDKVVKVNFGAKGMVIKKDNPAARKSFRARFNCDSPGPKHKARYWSCKKW